MLYLCLIGCMLCTRLKGISNIRMENMETVIYQNGIRYVEKQYNTESDLKGWLLKI